MKTAFITSTGRTGTDFFTTLFNNYVENTWSLHEPKPAFRRRSHQLLNRNHNAYDILYFKLPRLYRHRKKNAEWYIETNYHLATCFDFLRTVFPGSLIIHVIRDGREVVTSWLNKYRYITNEHLLPGHIRDDEAMEKWSVWNPLQKLAWYWKTVNNYAYSKNPDVWIQFEEIFKGDKKGIYRILDRFEGIGYAPEQVEQLLNRKVNSTRNRFFPDYQKWPEKWKDQFWEIAGNTMQKFGYSE
jgi:hypothetical protein